MADWLAYSEIEGLPSTKQDYMMAGQVCSAAANFSTWKLKSPMTPADFFGILRKEVEVEKPQKKITAEDQSALMMAALFGTTKAKAYGKKGT